MHFPPLSFLKSFLTRRVIYKSRQLLCLSSSRFLPQRCPFIHPSPNFEYLIVSIIRDPHSTKPP